MSITIDSEEYLTTAESVKYLHTSATTFVKWQRDYKLAHKTRPGLGNRKFFKKADLDKIPTWETKQ